MNERRQLDAAEAAARLGVKRQTLYAYVSRGLLRSHPAPNGRGSSFDPAEVDALLRRSRTGRESAQELTIATGVSSIADGELRYRGRLVPELARSQPYESVAALLWTGELAVDQWVASPAASAAVAAVAGVTPPGARLLDRIRLAIDVAAVTDPLRFELTVPSVMACGRGLVAVLVDSLEWRSRRRRPEPLVLPGRTVPAALASHLWLRLTDRPPTERAIQALNGALVLCADHEMATSTFAVRVAASTRANPYAAVSAGLGALDGPLHGTVSELVHALLVDAEADGVESAVVRRLRHGDRLPGFGHPLYPNGDPRSPALLDLVETDGFDRARLDVAAAVLDSVVDRTGVQPNVDFALGVLAYAGGMSADAGEAVFAIGRCAGWLAHAIEEYAEAPLRFRLRARSVM